MKMKNKILSAMMAVVATMSLISMSVFAADPSISFTPSVKEVKAGDTFTLVLNTANNPGVCGLSFLLNTDTNFDFTGVTNGSLYSGAGFDSDYKETNYAIGWVIDESFSANNTNSGEAATLTFKVNDNAQPGTYAITATTDTNVTMDKDFNPIDFGTATANITVVADEPAVETADRGYVATIKTVGNEKGLAFTLKTKDTNVLEANRTQVVEIPFASQIESGNTNATVGLVVENVPTNVELDVTAALYTE